MESGPQLLLQLPETNDFDLQLNAIKWQICYSKITAQIKNMTINVTFLNSLSGKQYFDEKEAP